MRGFLKKEAKPQAGLPNRRRMSQNNTSDSMSTEPRASFRRNQTLTGSSSGKVSSTNELSATLISPRAHVHHLSRKRKHLFLKLIAVVVCLLVIYLLVSQIVASTSVRVSQASVDQAAAKSYQKSIDNYLESHIFERYYPSLNQKKLLAYIQQDSPEVTSIDVSLTGEFGKAQTTLKLRKPVARWVVNGESQFVDEAGVVFSHNAYTNPGVIIEDKNAIKNVQTVASHRFLGFVGQVVGALKKEGYTVSKVSIPLLTTRMLEVKVSKVPYVIKMTVDRKAGEQSEDAARVIRFLKGKQSPKYIDVRVENKAFYK